VIVFTKAFLPQSKSNGEHCGECARQLTLLLTTLHDREPAATSSIPYLLIAYPTICSPSAFFPSPSSHLLNCTYSLLSNLLSTVPSYH